MAEFVNFEVVELPKLHLIGKELRHNMEAIMTGENKIPGFWEECMADNVFKTLEEQADFLYDKAYVGVMMDWERGDGNFSYIVGMLFKDGVKAPEGFIMKELEPTKAAVGWIKGKDVFDVCKDAHQMTEAVLKEKGLNCDKIYWCMEHYDGERFLIPDENGDIILDYYIPVE